MAKRFDIFQSVSSVLADTSAIQSTTYSSIAEAFRTNNESVAPAEDNTLLIEARAAASAGLAATTVTFRNVLAKISKVQAKLAVTRIQRLLEKVASLAKSGDLDFAVRILSDEGILEGTGFSFPPIRLAYGVDFNSAGNEETFIVSNWRNETYAVGNDGTVKLTYPPERRSFKNLSEQEFRWAQMAWIRLASEEIGHVAQILGCRFREKGYFLSQVIGTNGSMVRAEILKNIPDPLYAESSVIEADVYAYLIERYGPDLIPVWYGSKSIHFARFYVDDYLRIKGVPGRAW